MREFGLRIILVVLSSILGLIVCEQSLRIIPNRWNLSTFKYRYDPVFGRLPEISQRASYSGTCFVNRDLSTNSFGWRDAPRSYAKTGLRVAILGDSYTEALQVEDSEVFNRVLENEFSDVEFLNFGVSGFNTASELLLYRHHVRAFDPDIVIVMMYPENDIFDNSRKLRRASSDPNDILPSCYLQNGSLRYSLSNRAKPDWIEDRIKQNYFSITYQIYSYSRAYLSHQVNLFASHIGFKQRLLRVYVLGNAPPIKAADRHWNTIFGGSENIDRVKKEEKIPRAVSVDEKSVSWGEHPNNIFRNPPTHSWEDAWTISELLLLNFRAEVESDGSEFILVNIVANDDYFVDYASNEIDEEADRSLNRFYPYQRLEDFTRKKNINYLSLIPGFKQYVDENPSMEKPYFAFPCDGHWNALGHRVAARVMSEYLRVNKMLTKN